MKLLLGTSPKDRVNQNSRRDRRADIVDAGKLDSVNFDTAVIISPKTKEKYNYLLLIAIRSGK